MTAKKKAKAAKRKPAAGSSARVYPEAYYRVHALWVSVRAVALHEDELCTLMHEIKRSGELSGEVRGELRALLEEMPAADVVREAGALEAALARRGVRPGAKAKVR